MEITVKPEIKESINQIDSLIENAENCKISNPEHYKYAVKILADIKGKSKELNKERKSMTEPLDESKKKIMNFFNIPIGILIRAESIIKRAMINYMTEQERKEREANEKLRREAEAKTEKERKRLAEIEERERAKAKEAEEKRIEAEKKAKEAKNSEDRKKFEAEARRLEKEAEKAETKAEKFEEKSQDVQTGIVPTVQKQVEKQKGVSVRKVWKYRIVNEKLIPRMYYTLDETKIRKQVANFGKDSNIPGVEAYEESIVASASSKF